MMTARNAAAITLEYCERQETPMQYLLTIYEDEKLMGQRSEADMGELMSGYHAFTEELKASGSFVAGEPLQPTVTATTVRVRDGETLTTDGPFAETKEQLGGYYLVDCKDIDEAMSWAAKIPTAKYGSVEVRPIMVFE